MIVPLMQFGNEEQRANFGPQITVVEDFDGAWSLDVADLDQEFGKAGVTGGPGDQAYVGRFVEDALSLLLPEWERIRLLPHASAIHRYTVDRHVVETCIEASRLIRRVERPDLLLTAALLHDIGKGGRADHSVAGEPVAARAADRLAAGRSTPDS